MNISLRNLLVVAGAAIALVVAYNIAFPLLTRAEAAAMAAHCVGWPAEVADGIGANFHEETAVSDPVMLAFAHAKLVQVTDMGTCGIIRDSELVSAKPLHHLPAMSRVPGPKQDYVLYLLNEGSDGWVFAAVRAGTAVVQPEEQAQKPPGSI